MIFVQHAIGFLPVQQSKSRAGCTEAAMQVLAMMLTCMCWHRCCNASAGNGVDMHRLRQS